MHKLVILSWIGISPEAVHYMGRLEGYDTSGEFSSIDLDYIMDDDRAAQLNTVYKKQSPGDPAVPFRRGMRSNKFDTIEDVIKAGREASRIHFPKSKMVIVRP